MFHHIHPDMRVASHLARWGVKARTPEARAAQAMFLKYEHLASFVTYAYGGADAGKLFVAKFNTGNEDASSAPLADLALAHRLGVTAADRAIFAAVVNEMIQTQAQGRFPERAEKAWELLTQLGPEVLVGFIARGTPFLDTSVHFNIRVLLEAGVSADYLRDVGIFLSPGNMKRGDYTVQEAIAMSAANVPSEYAASLSKVIPSTTSREYPVIGLFQHGVPPQYAHGCIAAGLDMDEIFRLWQEGVPLAYATAVTA